MSYYFAHRVLRVCRGRMYKRTEQRATDVNERKWGQSFRHWKQQQHSEQKAQNVCSKGEKSSSSLDVEGLAAVVWHWNGFCGFLKEEIDTFVFLQGEIYELLVRLEDNLKIFYFFKIFLNFFPPQNFFISLKSQKSWKTFFPSKKRANKFVKKLSDMKENFQDFFHFLRFFEFFFLSIFLIFEKITKNFHSPSKKSAKKLSLKIVRHESRVSFFKTTRETLLHIYNYIQHT